MKPRSLLYAITTTVLVAPLLVPAASTAQAATTATPDLESRLGQILRAEYAADEPGAAAIVVDGGEVVYRGASGMANVELGVALSPEMVFRLGSITKQFTAAAILMLAEEGLLSLDDPITATLPDYPTHGHDITLHHLMTHTSGIFNYTNDAEIMGSTVRLDVSTEELVDSFKDRPMDFAPGEQWNYSNSGYVLLGAVIEAVTGKSYAEFIQEQIFDPLDMKDSHYGGHQRIPGRVAGYQWSGEDFENAMYLSMTQPHAAGSLLSSVDDMARWNEALFGGELLSPESLAIMTTETKLNDGSGTDYAYGLGVNDFRGTDRISHGGGIFGFNTSGMYFPEEGVYVAVLSNRTGVPGGPGLVAARMAAEALGQPLPEFERASVDPSVLERYVGVYRIDESTTRTFNVEDGHIYTERSDGSRAEAFPYSDSGFFYENDLSYFEMLRTGDGGLEMHMFANGSLEPEIALLTGEPLPTSEEIELDPAVFAGYVGRYQLAPGFELEVSTDGERFLGQATGQPQVEIFAKSETEFFLKVVAAELTFEVDGSGRATAVVLRQGGQEMRGERIED